MTINYKVVSTGVGVLGAKEDENIKTLYNLLPKYQLKEGKKGKFFDNPDSTDTEIEEVLRGLKCAQEIGKNHVTKEYRQHLLDTYKFLKSVLRRFQEDMKGREFDHKLWSEYSSQLTSNYMSLFKKPFFPLAEILLSKISCEKDLPGMNPEKIHAAFLKFRLDKLVGQIIGDYKLLRMFSKEVTLAKGRITFIPYENGEEALNDRKKISA